MAFDPSILRDVQMFKLFDEDELRELCAAIEERHYVAGQTVFRLGDPGGAMHVVLSGRVELFIVDNDGRRALVGSAEHGEIFGEFSLFDNEARSASALAVVPTRTVCIERKDLTLLFTKKPQAALDILAVLSRRLRRTDLMLAEHMAPNANAVIEEKATLGDRIADGVARVGGSWAFINTFTVVLFVWMGLNSWQWFGMPTFDPPPFIGLNLLLSTIAALQAPVIMMSQNRQDAKDRVRGDIEYEVNLRAEMGVRELQAKVDTMKEELIDLLVAVRDRR
jgi:CRP/FNR family transcriptional regulator, cyclic AMP receptor protein